MRRERLPVSALPAWARLNDVQLNGVKIDKLDNGFGSGIIATEEITEHRTELVVVPPELILNQERIWLFAKSDKHLREVLEANGDFAKTSRGAILIFLLMQISMSSPDMPKKIGVSNAWSEYIKFIPDETSLPTFWNDEERKCLWATSMEKHLEAKLRALDREFRILRKATQNLEWCKAWWDDESGCLSIHDWKIVDAMYRSRAMDFDEYGLCMVPVMDMANHDDIARYLAMYTIDKSNLNAHMTLEHGRYLEIGEEVTIMYGFYRGATDSLFSYGFIEPDLPNAQAMFLGMSPPEDDPLAPAKMAAMDTKPGVKVYMQQTADITAWASAFVWAMCVNEEDGLEIRVAEKTNGEHELVTTWKGEEVNATHDLEHHLKYDRLKNLFQLRAYAMVNDCLEEEIKRREQLEWRPDSFKIPNSIDPENSRIWQTSELLRKLERKLLQKATRQYGQTIQHLYGCEEVVRWFKGNSADGTADAYPEVSTEYSDHWYASDGDAEGDADSDRDNTEASAETTIAEEAASVQNAQNAAMGWCVKRAEPPKPKLESIKASYTANGLRMAAIESAAETITANLQQVVITTGNSDTYVALNGSGVVVDSMNETDDFS